MTLALLIVGGLAATGLLTTYLLYPAFVVLYARAVGPRRRVAAGAESNGSPADPTAPLVSLIIAAHDEEEAIGDKIANSLALEIPAGVLEVIVASDGSTDRTDAIVEAFDDPRVRLVRNPVQQGKTATTNLAASGARGRFLVFSDATGMYEPGALRALLQPFADPSVGAVSGRVRYRYGGTATARGFRLYQRWVVAQRQAETRLHTTPSVSGSIHAIRRELFLPAPAHLSYDMVVPAMMAMQGRRTEYADAAVSWEVSRTRARDEMAARGRIALAAYGFLAWLRRPPRPLESRAYLLQLFAHKVLRWFSPHLLILLLLAHVGLALLHGGPWAWLLVPHVGGYALGAAAVLLDRRGRRLPGLGPLMLFCAVNAAFLAAFLRWLRGAEVTAWKPDRRAEREAARGEASEGAERKP